MSTLPRLIVSVPWGPLAGLKRVMAPGERLRVGRNERADLVIAGDEEISAVHFELVWDGVQGHLRDLESARGIKADGKRVSEATLGEGGWVRAGSTDFVLHLEGARPPEDLDDTVVDEELAARDPEGVTARMVARWERQQKRARRAEIHAALVEAVAGERLHAVLDAARDPRILELCAAAPDEARSLYEGVTGDAMSDMAPHLVRFSPGSHLLENLLLHGWGERWGIYLTSTQPFKELRRHLRRFLVVEDDETGEELIFRYYDPEVLGAFLPSCSPRQAEELYSDVDAFYYEDERGGLIRRTREEAMAAAAGVTA